MNQLDFIKNVGLNPPLVKAIPLPDVDQFQASEFFEDENHMKLCDFDVFARAQNNVELQNKIRQQMIETDVKGFDSSVSDDEVFSQISSKYDSTTSILDRVKARIVELRSAQKAAQ